MVLPTHVVAEPSHGLVEHPNTSFLFPDPSVFVPLETEPHIEKLRAYHAVLDRWNMMENPLPEDTRWHIKEIIQLSNKPRKDGTRSIYAKIRYSDGPKTWISLDNLRLEDPYLVIEYVIANGLQHHDGFQWVNQYVGFDEECLQCIKAFAVTKKKKKGKQIKFGSEVPRNVKHALEIDKENGNKKWQEAMKLEVSQLFDFNVFRVLEDGEPVPEGFTRIPHQIVFDVKFDGRLKARLVGGGHRTPEVHHEEVFSSVVSMEAVRLGFLIAKLNDLQGIHS